MKTIKKITINKNIKQKQILTSRTELIKNQLSLKILQQKRFVGENKRYIQNKENMDKKSENIKITEEYDEK